MAGRMGEPAQPGRRPGSGPGAGAGAGLPGPRRQAGAQGRAARRSGSRLIDSEELGVRRDHTISGQTVIDKWSNRGRALMQPEQAPKIRAHCACRRAGIERFVLFPLILF